MNKGATRVVKPTEGDPSTHELLNEELRHRLDVQRAAFVRIEGRAAIVLGASFAAVQFVSGQDARSAWLPWAVAAYLAGMAFSLMAVLPGSFEELKPRALVVGLWLWPRGKAAAELANARLTAFEKNVGRQGRLVVLLRVAVILTIVGGIMSIVHLTSGERSNVNEGPRVPASTTVPDDATTTP